MTFSFNDLAFISYRRAFVIAGEPPYDFSTGARENLEAYSAQFILDSGVSLTGGFGWGGFPYISTGYIRYVGMENMEGYATGFLFQSGNELTSGDHWERTPMVISGWSYYTDLPTNYTGLTRWFKADDYWYLNNGQTVGTPTTPFRDYSDNQAHMYFNTILYPTVNINTQSSLPSIRFQTGAITGAFTGLTATMAPPFTVFMAFATNTTGGTNAQVSMNEMTLYGHSGDTVDKTYFIMNYTGSTTALITGSYYSHVGNYGRIRWGKTPEENNVRNIVKCVAFTVHTPTGASGTLYKIMSKVSSTNVGLTGVHFDRVFFNNSGHVPTGFFNSIGRTPTTTYADVMGTFSGYFCEAILYSGEFADSGVSLINNYLKPKWRGL